MNALTKVLVVLVLVLSVAFAAAEMVLYRKREDFATKYREASEQLQTAQRDLETRNGELSDLKGQTDLTIAGLRQQVLTLEDQVKDEQARANDLNTSLEQERANVGRLTEATQSQQTRIDTLLTSLDGLKTQVTELQGIITTKENSIKGLQDTVVQRDTTITDLTVELTQVKQVKTELAEEKGRLDGIIAQLRTLGFRIPPAPTPPINALVISADNALGTVVINKGTDGQVKPNTHFTLYDDEGFIATLVIHEVSDTVAGGRVIRTAEGRQVHVGASATTEIQLD